MTFTRTNNKLAPHHNRLVQANTLCLSGSTRKRKATPTTTGFAGKHGFRKHRGRLGVQMGPPGKHTPRTPHPAALTRTGLRSTWGRAWGPALVCGIQREQAELSLSPPNTQTTATKTHMSVHNSLS